MILRRFRFEVPDGTDASRLTRANLLLFKRGLEMRVLPYDRARRRPGRVGDVHRLVARPRRGELARV